MAGLYYRTSHLNVIVLKDIIVKIYGHRNKEFWRCRFWWTFSAPPSFPLLLLHSVPIPHANRVQFLPSLYDILFPKNTYLYTQCTVSIYTQYK